MSEEKKSAAAQWALLWPRAARWALELLLVFAGVYGAFALNTYQAHRQERQRREQLLTWMQADSEQSLAALKEERAEIAKIGDNFKRRLAAGEMPPLEPLHATTNYDSSDTASVLESGGFELMEVETVRAIKDVDATARLMVNYTAHCQELSDALILPNLDKDPGVFYDPATHKLRRAYEWYPKFFDNIVKAFDSITVKMQKAIDQLRADRAQRR
jgi:hypothetical protein